MSEKLDHVNEYINNFISANFPELSRFKIKMNEEALYFNNILNGYKHVLYIGLGHLNYPHEQVVNGGFQCWTEVTFAEDLLIKLLSKHNLHVKQLFPTIWFNKFTVSNFKTVWDSFRQFDEYDLSTNKQALADLCEHYKKTISQNFIPFWEKHSNMQYINDEIINKVPENDLDDFLSDMPKFKKLIIMKLCSNPNYDEYKKYINSLVENALIEDNEQNKPYADLFKELTEILETKK